MICCSGEGYHEEGCGLKYVSTIVRSGLVEMSCKAEKFPACELLDTSVQISIDDLCITWKDKERLAGELNAVVEKYLL